MSIVNYANFTNLYLNEPLSSSKVNLWFEKLMENVDDLIEIDVDEKQNKYRISNTEKIYKSLSISCELGNDRIAICIGGDYNREENRQFIYRIFETFTETTEIYPISIKMIECNQVWGFSYKGNQIELIEDSLFKKRMSNDIFSGKDMVPINTYLSMSGWIDADRKAYIEIESNTDYQEIENNEYEDKPFVISVKIGLADPIEKKVFKFNEMINQHNTICYDFFETKVKPNLLSIFDKGSN